jgi:SAM-dependent methyltransferase
VTTACDPDGPEPLAGRRGGGGDVARVADRRLREAGAAAQAPRRSGGGRVTRARGGGHRHRGRYGNPEDLASCIARQEDPARAAWQKPGVVMRALGLRRGQVVADVGAGPGYFTLRLARAVGPGGHVYAVDPEPVILDALRERIARARLRNVTPILGRADDPLLPAGRCHLVLIVDTYHHFPAGPAFLRRAARALTRGGRLVNIDFVRRETPVGPPVEHRVRREEFLRDARRAGLELVAEHRVLPYQYFLILEAR